MSKDPEQAPAAIAEARISVLASIGDRVYELKKSVNRGDRLGGEAARRFSP